MIMMLFDNLPVKMNSYTLMPALSSSKRYLGKERRVLSIAKSPKKGDQPSPAVVKESKPIENPQNREDIDSESQETLYKGSEDILKDDLVEEDSERPKSGLKRKFEELITKEEGSVNKCISSDEEVEIVDVKKPRKSVEYICSRSSSLLSQRSASPLRSLSSKSSSNTSSQSSTSSQKSVRSKKLHLIIDSPKKIDDSLIRKFSNSEDYCTEEEFTLHMSPSQGSQLDSRNGSCNASVESSVKDGKSTGAMSTIMEVDEGCVDELQQSHKKDEVVPTENKSADDNPSGEVATDYEVSAERSSCEAIRPSSPEYLSDDQAKSWMNLSTKPFTPSAVDEKRIVEEGSAVEENKVSSEDKDKDPILPTEPAKTEVAPGLKNGHENGVSAEDPASELIRNGDPSPPKIHQWLLIHVCSDVNTENGQYVNSKLLEMFDYRQILDGTKASSMESKSSTGMADISSPSTNASPQSTSGEGKMFPLPPPRTSIMSTFSHSSSSTSGSDVILNPKLLDLPKFTKPFLPSNVSDDRIPNLREIIPDIKTGKRVRIEGTSGSSDTASDIMEEIKSEFEQCCYKYLSSTTSSQSVTPKVCLEDASKVVHCDRRYLTARRPKTKRASLRTKRKISTSTKTVTPQTSSGSNQLVDEDEMDTAEEKITPAPSKLTECPPERTSPPQEILKTRSTKRKTSRSSQSSQSSSKSEPRSTKFGQLGSPTPTEDEPEIPMTPGSSTLKTECIEGIIQEGALVFARFGDSWYYSGKVRERDKGDRWIIEFDDGAVRSVLEKFIVAVDVRPGQSLHADVGVKNPEYESGIVTKVETKKNQVYYTVELDNGSTKTFPRAKLGMTEDQAAILQDMVVDPVMTTPKRKADVSLDNLLESRTRRKKASSSLGSVSAGPSTPGPSKTLSAKKLEATVYESSFEMGTSDCSELGYSGISGLEPPTSPEPHVTPGSKGKGPGRRKGVGKQLNLSESIAAVTRISSGTRSQLGPIPAKGSNLFKGKYFILSYGSDSVCSSESQEVTKSYTDTSTDGDATDTNDGKIFSSLPFDKKHLRRQLEAGGGRVFDHFKDECIGKLSFLVSNRPNLTPDYVLALSADIRIVSHEWIVNCCVKNEQLPWEDNLLSIGWSIEKRRYIESHERTKQSLKDVEVILASDSGNRFLEFWRRVLVMAGAHVRKISSKTMSSQEDISYAAVVVTDETCPERILNCANETAIPVVSTEWVKQTLIHGEMRPFKGHVMYSYDYKDE
ncbi:uncharacterized protein LOC124166703 isoform X2 [Ischnura elegans]|uniref:uncharacterized protein LOC124166703 isoform X2 n=1 Tax=Ischnura elegans TaxID=197161 RepID=UPI001ED8B4C2|nr:uncharacterized protein LOC124166703 isoform X2 [Ischnura elegans]